jgi:hypothetical protein
MKTKILFILLFLFFISAISSSQVSSGSLTAAERNDSVLQNFSTLNGASFVKPFAIGTETSGFFYYPEYPWIETYGVSMAFYKGHSFALDKRNGGFALYSPLYHTFNESPADYRYSDTFILFAPGISLFSLNRKFSFDLYKKLNSQTFFYGNQQIAPLKVNLYF